MVFKNIFQIVIKLRNNNTHFQDPDALDRMVNLLRDESAFGEFYDAFTSMLVGRNYILGLSLPCFQTKSNQKLHIQC